MHHPEGSVQIKCVLRILRYEGASVIVTEKKLGINGNSDGANTLSRWASINLDNSEEIDCRSVGLSIHVGVDLDLDAHVVRNLSNSLNDEGQFKEALPLNKCTGCELKTLAVIKICLSDQETNLSD